MLESGKMKEKAGKRVVDTPLLEGEPGAEPTRFRVKKSRCISWFGSMTWKMEGEIISRNDYGFERLQSQLELEPIDWTEDGMAFTDEEKARIRTKMSSLVEMVMDCLTPDGEDRARHMLQMMERVECRISEVKDGSVKPFSLEHEFMRWGYRLADQLRAVNFTLFN
jgi:hypothetical protein